MELSKASQNFYLFQAQALLPHLMQIEDPGVLFDLCMHLGTALAVILYFRDDLYRFIKKIPKLFEQTVTDHDVFYMKNLLISTFISVVAIVILIPVSKLARDPKIIIFNLIFFGIVLAVADWFHQKTPHRSDEPLRHKLQIKDALIIGLAQALAIFPGVSRSGITLSASFMQNLKREQAARFSFMLSLPIILAGAAMELPKVFKGEGAFEMAPLLVGILSSFVVGFLTIHFFMKLIARIRLIYFSIYRIIVALIMLVVLY